MVSRSVKVKAIYKFDNGSKIELSIFDTPQISYMWGERFFLTKAEPEKNVVTYEIRRPPKIKSKNNKKVLS